MNPSDIVQPTAQVGKTSLILSLVSEEFPEEVSGVKYPVCVAKLAELRISLQVRPYIFYSSHLLMI